MSSRLPSLRPQQVMKVFKKAGWNIARQRGSHVTMVKKSEENILVIPFHKGKDLKHGLLHALIKDAGLTIDKFLKLL